MRHALWIVIATACGRYGFHPAGDAPTAPGDAAGLDADAPIDAEAGTTPFVVQTSAMFATASSVTATCAATRQGSALVVATASVFVQDPVTAVSDDVGNVYVSAASQYTCTTTATLGELWYSPNARAGATAVTVTSAGSEQREVWLLEIANADPVTPIDNAQVVNDGMTDGATVVSPAVTPSSLPSVVLSVANVPSSVGALVGTQFTSLPTLFGDDAAYTLATIAGNYGAVWTDTTAGQFCSRSVAIR